MELTYENMVQFIKNYFDNLPTLDGSEESARRLGEFLAPELMVRLGGGAGREVLMLNKEQRIARLNGHADVYRAVIQYEPYPLYIIADEKKKIVTAMITEKNMYPKTREVYQEIALGAVFELKLDENNNIKIKRQLTFGIGGTMESI